MSRLFVKTDYNNGKTIISDCSFTTPLKVAKPFYYENGYTEVMIMCASPGMLDGDFFDWDFVMGNNTKTIISAQSYQKIFKGSSRHNTRIQVGENSALCYIPEPIIPFAGSSFHSRTDIILHSSSKLILCDICTGGRIGMGEEFAFSKISSRIAITINGKLIFLDNTLFNPEKVELAGIGFFEGYLCQGFIYLYGYGDVFLPDVNGIEASVSKAKAGYSVRIFGSSGDDVYRFCKEVVLYCNSRHCSTP